MRGCACAYIRAVSLHGITWVYVHKAGALALHQTRPGFCGPVYSRVRVQNCVQVSGTHWVGSLNELGRFQCVCASAQKNSSSVPLQKALCCFLSAFAVLWRDCFSVLQMADNILICSLLPKYFIIGVSLPFEQVYRIPSILLCKKLA